MRIGFLGFGEAGYVIAKGLLAKGCSGLVAFDCNYRHPTLGEKIQHRAEELGVRLLPSNADLAAETDVILSVVTAASALEAASQTAAGLRRDQIFCDCNSVSPSRKARIGAVVQEAAAAFVEVAIMAPAHADFSRMPMLITGEQAPRFADYFRRFGMKIEVMQGETGAAAAVKMCRSIVIKGLEALLVECMVTARHFGCEEAVLRNLNESNPEFKWNELSEYLIGRVLEHGVRRAAEMQEVAAMQREAGLPDYMSSATAEVQNWRGRLPEARVSSNDELISVLGGSGVGSR
jgi:3-hydroxyisobutyrate dehydrogenase